MSPKPESGGRRNKRKSHEPKRVATELTSLRRHKLQLEDSTTATSDGEERNDSPRGASTPDDSYNRGSSSSETSAPSPKLAFNDYQKSLAPPKKRFKHDPDLLNFHLNGVGKTVEAPPSPPTTPSPNLHTAANKIHRPWDSDANGEYKVGGGLDPFALGPEQAKAFVAAAMASQQTGGGPSGLLALYKLYPQLFDVNLLSALAVSSEPTKSWSAPAPEQEEPLALIKKPAAASASSPKKAAATEPSGKKSAAKSSAAPEAEEPPEAPAGNLLQSRNYKNMTRERRVEANARERQRVHTITAAFDTLQSLIPSPENVAKPPPPPESEEMLEQVKDVLFPSSSSAAAAAADGGDRNQYKLSKLSIIKIATSYIMLLSRLAGYDYTEDKSEPTVEDCMRQCSSLLNQEAKCKRKEMA